MSSRLIARGQTLAVSAAIVLVIVLQGLASFRITVGPIEPPPFLWPFLDYPMYEQPRYQGDPIEQRVVVGVLADSTEVVISPEDLDVTFWQVQNVLSAAILQGDQARASAYRSMSEERYGQRVLGFRLENHPVVLTDQGPIAGPRVILGSLVFSPE